MELSMSPLSDYRRIIPFATFRKFLPALTLAGDRASDEIRQSMLSRGSVNRASPLSRRIVLDADPGRPRNHDRLALVECGNA